MLCNGFHEVKKKYLSLHRASLKARQNRRYGENDREHLAKTVSAISRKGPPQTTLEYRLMELINDFFGRVFDYLRDNPKYGLLVAMLLGTLYLIGIILNWKWTLLPGSSGDLTQMWIEIFGEKAVRFGKGVMAVLLLACLFYLYLKL